MNESTAQRGQALIEVLVLSAALVPLLLAVPLIAKYQDIRHAAVAASRTAAFECSVRLDGCAEPGMQLAMANDLRRRHFASHNRDLMSADGLPEDAPAEERNRFWVDRRGAALLAKASDVSLGFAAGRSDAVGGALRRGADAAGKGARGPAGLMSSLAGPGNFGLDAAGGLVTTQVRASVSLNRTLAQWLQKPEGMQLGLAGRTAVMVDAWNASSGTGSEPRSFHSRLEHGRRLPDIGDAAADFGGALRAAPAGAVGSPGNGGTEEAIDLLYAPIRSLITGPLLAPVEPNGSLFRYHEIDVEVVPADRIGETG